MEHSYWVVDWLRKLMQDAHIATSVDRCRKNCLAEILFADSLRAREGEQYSAAFNLLESPLVDSLVTLQCVVERTLVLGKSRRVENYQVILVGCLGEKVESIECKTLMVSAIGEIKCDIAVGLGYGRFRHIDSVHRTSASAKRINTEASRVAENVANSASRRVVGKQLAVFALVDEKACFLPVFPINLELMAVLQYYIGVGLGG